MRVARVLSPESASPILALERDGAVYDVVALAADASADDLFAPSSDFHARVVALSGAGLDELDDRLRAGRRPSGARLLPETFVWLAPLDPSRAAAVHVGLGGSPDATRVWLGSARAVEGHASRAACASDPVPVELAVAALVGEELRHATESECARAVIGWSIALRWGESPPATPEAALGIATQIGPVLVTRDEAGSPEQARFRLRVGAEVVEGRGFAGSASVAEAIARASALVPLEAGDVVISGPLARAIAKPGALVTGAVERLGVLEGTCARAGA